MGDLNILFLRGFYLTKAEQLKKLLSDHAVTNSDDFKEELLSAARDGVLEPWCKKRGLQLTGVNLKDTNNSLYEALVKAVTGMKEFKATDKAFIGNFAEALKEEDVKYDEESKTLKISIRPIKPTNERFDFVVMTKGGKFLANSGGIDWKDKTKNSPVSLTFNLKGMPEAEEDDAVLFVDGTERIRVIERSKPKRNFSVNGVDFNMILVRKGTFMMGATPEQKHDPSYGEMPVHQVTLSNDYYIGETMVTQALWKAIMVVHRSSFSGDQLPVGCVSWTECQVFIKRLNQLTGKTFRLPTEAEWEYAARGGNKSKYYKYAGSNNINNVGWYLSNSGYHTHPSCEREPNELGIYDMSGNVEEWCNDWYGLYSPEAQTDPQGPSRGEFRVLRGGHYRIESRGCRVSSRNYSIPSAIDDCMGFRLVLTL